MRYFSSIFFLSFLWYSLSFSVEISKSDNFELQIDKLQELKKKSQESNVQRKTNIFDDLQNYGRLAGQVATSVVLLSSSRQDKKNQNSSFLSVHDQSNIIQATVTCFLLMIELARYCHDCKVQTTAIKAMSYKEFVVNFPNLVLVEHQIILMKRLIDLSMQGTLPERVFSIIQLTKSSLPLPYAKFAEKSAKKMRKECFDDFGNFVLVELSGNKHPYKKFRKKVPQHWHQIAFQANKFPKVIEPYYDSSYASLLDTDYNNALIKIIHAGIKKDMMALQDVRNVYAGNALIEQLFNYFMCL